MCQYTNCKNTSLHPLKRPRSQPSWRPMSFPSPFQSPSLSLCSPCDQPHLYIGAGKHIRACTLDECKYKMARFLLHTVDPELGVECIFGAAWFLDRNESVPGKKDKEGFFDGLYKTSV